MVSVGRGTDAPFQLYGHPDYTKGEFSFTPTSKPGAKYPKHENKVCNGYDLSTIPVDSLQRIARFDLTYLIDFYQNSSNKSAFFNSNGFFHKLSGDKRIMQMIKDGKTEVEIRATWTADVEAFKAIREKYLLY